MNLRELLDVKRHSYKMGLWTIVLFLSLLMLGCSDSDLVNNKADESTGVAIPSLISALVVPSDTTAFTANLFLDSGTTPIASANIATDGTQTTVSFSGVRVDIGTHRFTLEFALVTATYGELYLATVTSEPIDVSDGATQSLNFDVTKYLYPDDDNDLVSNLDEIIRGTDPTVDESHTVSSIELAIASPASLDFGQRLDVRFNYATNQSGGVRILVRPYTAGSASANYSACGSPLYATAVGSGNCFITINTGAITVDEIVVQMWADGQAALLYEKLVPVKYQYSALDNVISNVKFTPVSPGLLVNGAKVSMTFDYKTTEVGGVRIFARPFSHGGLTPNYGASGSVLHLVGTGSGSQSFTITSGASVVDQIRFLMIKDGSKVILQKYFYNVNYAFYNPIIGPPPVIKQSTDNQITIVPTL